jgi:Domain of unknown function (DUF4296)
MQKILWDIALAQAYASQLARKDSSLNEVAMLKVFSQKVFELHNTDSVEFNRSYAWYTDHPGTLLLILDSLTAQNQREILQRVQNKNNQLQKAILKKVE